MNNTYHKTLRAGSFFFFFLEIVFPLLFIFFGLNFELIHFCSKKQLCSQFLFLFFVSDEEQKLCHCILTLIMRTIIVNRTFAFFMNVLLLVFLSISSNSLFNTQILFRFVSRVKLDLYWFYCCCFFVLCFVSWNCKNEEKKKTKSKLEQVEILHNRNFDFISRYQLIFIEFFSP